MASWRNSDDPRLQECRQHNARVGRGCKIPSPTPRRYQSPRTSSYRVSGADDKQPRYDQQRKASDIALVTSRSAGSNRSSECELRYVVTIDRAWLSVTLAGMHRGAGPHRARLSNIPRM